MKVGDEVYLKHNPSMKGVIHSGSGHLICVDWSNGVSDTHWGSSLILASEYEKNLKETKGHPNASILMEIAKEAAVNPEYWKEFEVMFSEAWETIPEESRLFSYLHYEENIRRKPRTIRIGNYDVPEPIREAPKIDSKYYVCSMESRKVFHSTWGNETFENKHLESGLLHETKEGAELMLKALQELLGKK